MDLLLFPQWMSGRYDRSYALWGLGYRYHFNSGSCT